MLSRGARDTVPEPCYRGFAFVKAKVTISRSRTRDPDHICPSIQAGKLTITMTSYATALKFFEACETNEGWEGCSQYVVDEKAPFKVQAAALKDRALIHI